MASKGPLPAEVTTARARAAIAYSMRQQQDIEVDVVATGKVTAANFRRIVGVTDPRAASEEELNAIADVCIVPRRFMRDGFARLDAPEGDADLREQVSRTEDQLDAVQQTVAALSQEVGRLRRQGTGTGSGEVADLGGQPGGDGA